MVVLIVENARPSLRGKRVRYERGQAFRGYRNGHAPERMIGVGMGAVSVRMPRVSDVPKEVAPDGFESLVQEQHQPPERAMAGGI